VAIKGRAPPRLGIKGRLGELLRGVYPGDEPRVRRQAGSTYGPTPASGAVTFDEVDDVFGGEQAA
jgi:hypothetical protein